MITISLLLHRVVYALDRAADRRLRRELGVSHGRAVLLRAIAMSEPCSQHELAVQLGHTDPAVTGMMRELVADGLAEVRNDPDNGRRRLVALTPAGADVVHRATAMLDTGMAELIAVSGVDARVLHDELAKLDTALVQTGVR